jgi:hypothetical protein
MDESPEGESIHRNQALKIQIPFGTQIYPVRCLQSNRVNADYEDLCRKYLSNPPNPPLSKGGEGGFSSFVGGPGAMGNCIESFSALIRENLRPMESIDAF